MQSLKRLRGHILTLKRVRDAYSDVLDASIQAELNDVIKELERTCDEGLQKDFGALAQRAVVVIAAVVEVVTNIRDLLR